MKPVAGECLKGKIYKLEYGREGFLINLGIWQKYLGSAEKILKAFHACSVKQSIPPSTVPV